MLAGCSSAPKEPAAAPENPSEGEQTPVQGGTYIIRQATDPGSFNPDIKGDDMATYTATNVFNRLVKTTASTEIIPDLAESWEFSEDGKTLSVISSNVTDTYVSRIMENYAHYQELY